MFCSHLFTCLVLQYLEDRYRRTGGEFAVDDVSEFSFASDSAKVQLDIDKLQFNSDAAIDIVSISDIRKVEYHIIIAVRKSLHRMYNCM